MKPRNVFILIPRALSSLGLSWALGNTVAQPLDFDDEVVRAHAHTKNCCSSVPIIGLKCIHLKKYNRMLGFYEYLEFHNVCTLMNT